MKNSKDFRDLKRFIKNPIPFVSQILRDSPYPIMVLDNKYEIIYFNDNVLRLHRIDYSKVLHKNFLGQFSTSKEHYIEMHNFFENINKTRKSGLLACDATRTEMLIMPLYSHQKDLMEFYLVTNIVALEGSDPGQKNMRSLNHDYANFTHHLSSLIEAKDKYTALHSANVEKYSVMLGKAIGMSEYDLEILRIAASIHDVGKIKIPNTILNKPGKLTEHEFDIIKKHTKYTTEILGTLEFFSYISTGAGYHHERYDGNGYLDGISGDDIPLMSRIMAIADTFDAMTTDRSYRNALPIKTALDEITRCKWSQFDPYLVDKFVNLDFDISSKNGEDLENELLNIHKIPKNIKEQMYQGIMEVLLSLDIFELLQYVFSTDIYGVIVMTENKTESKGKYQVIYQNHFVDKLLDTGAIPEKWEPCLRGVPEFKCTHCYIATCQLRGETINRNVRLTNKFGNDMYLDVRTFPYHEFSSDTVYIVEILRNVTNETVAEKNSVADFFNFIDNLYVQFAENNEGLARINSKLKPLATWIANKLRLEPYDIELLHKALSICDLGIIALADSNEFRYKSLTELRGSKHHIETINNLIKEFKSFRDVKDIVLHHHNFYNEKSDVGRFVADEVPIHSYIIATADHIITKMVEGNKLDDILNKFEERAGLELSPQIANVILEGSARVELAMYIEELDDIYGEVTIEDVY